jgi:hypothetical protein
MFKFDIVQPKGSSTLKLKEVGPRLEKCDRKWCSCCKQGPGPSAPFLGAREADALETAARQLCHTKEYSTSGLSRP